MGLGIHVSKSTNLTGGKPHKTYFDAIKESVEILDMTSIAFFVIGPMSKTKLKMDFDKINKYCKDNKISIWNHMSYISVGVWKINKENEKKDTFFIQHVMDHLEAGAKLGAKGSVLHVPRHPISTITETLEILSEQEYNGMPKLILETPASKPHAELTYETAEKLNKLVDAIVGNKNITIPWTICIDSAHEYAGGVDFSKDWDKWEKALSKETRNRINLIHLNGAEGKNFGTGKDIHRIPLSQDDSIWGNLISDGFRDRLKKMTREDITNRDLYKELSQRDKTAIKKSSLNTIIQFAKKHNISLIMELNTKDFANAKLAMDVINKLLK